MEILKTGDVKQMQTTYRKTRTHTQRRKTHRQIGKERNKREGYKREFQKLKVLAKQNSNLSPPKMTSYTYHYTKAMTLK